MNELKTMHLFAGVGGGILADLILGHRPVVAVEWDKYACRVLRERVADGWFDGVEVWEGDVREFAAHDYKGRVDCIHAGFPCQDISLAGNQAGVGEDTRSGLYREVLRIADEVRPEYIFLENVAAIVTGDDGAMLRTVVGDLAERGYDAVWTCLSAAEVSANHKRDRWWLLGYPNNDGASAIRNFGVLQREPHGKKKEIIKSQGSSISDTGSDRLENRNKRNGRKKRKDISGITNNRNSIRGEVKCDDRVSSKTNVSDTMCERRCSRNTEREDATPARELRGSEGNNTRRMGWWDIEPDVGRVANGIPNRTHRLKGLGNAQVPLQAATAFKLLWEIKNDKNTAAE